MSNITNLLRQNYILKLKNDSIKMQPSITMFFKSKQPENQAESEPNEPLENKDNSESGTPPKRDIGDSVKTSQTENSIKLSANDSVKRSAECADDRTPRKRLAVSSGTPSKVKNDQEALLTPRKSEGVISSPNKKPTSQENKVMPCVSPLIDINGLIRKKISCGASSGTDFNTPKQTKQSAKTPSYKSHTTPKLLPKEADQGAGGGTGSQDEPMKHPHLNYKFLYEPDRRDIKGRKPDDPDYDEKTLYVPAHFLTSQSPAMRQWWLLKQRNMDTILFFKMGKFYELFNEDAVIGVNKLEINFMKGDGPAHAGFPEISYDKYSELLVSKGFKVARVEQVETPEMMEERCQETRARGGARCDKIVAREICRITTRGTQMPGIMEQVFHSAKNQYLLAIYEFQVEASNSTVSKIKEFGVCFVDVTIGKLYLGQFQDDNNLSKLNILLAHHTPTEVLYEKGNLDSQTHQALLRTGADLTILKPTKEFWPIKTALGHLKVHNIFQDENGKFEWPTMLHHLFEEGVSSESLMALEPKDSYRHALNSFGAIVYYLQSQLILEQVLKCVIFEIYQTPLDCRSNSSRLYNSNQKDKISPPMIVDHIALRNLEIFENSTGGTLSTLYESINYCKTHFGQRLLKNWVCSPLCDIKQINNRLDAVEALVSNQNVSLTNEFVHVLKNLPDLERILCKIKSQCFKSENDTRAVMFDSVKYSRAKIDSFLNLLQNFKRLQKFIQSISKTAKNCDSDVLKRLLSFTTDGGLFPDYSSTLDYFESRFNQDLAQKEGKIIPAPGVDEDYDNCQASIDVLKSKLDAYLEEQMRVINCRRIEYFGTGKNRYQIQVPEANCKKVPDEYRIETTRKGFKRYMTPTIEKLFKKLTCHEEEMKRILDRNMSDIFAQFSKKINLWSAAIECMALLDVLQSIASFVRSLKASNVDVCRPEFLETNGKPIIDYVDGRHPSLVKLNSDYIPNSLILDDRSILLSGANMGGKSTLMRQTALMVILAQIGCFVPASRMRLTPVDRIFSRLGASDRLLEGESTFYTELVETSAMIRCATSDSLLLLDELGRGTSTYDGTAIAYSVLEEISNNIKCRCLFSTHYHTLVRDFEKNDKVRLAHMACKVDENDSHEDDENSNPLEENITFLYKIAEGPVGRSYGFNVARLAGVQNDIIREAKRKADELELYCKILETLQKVCLDDNTFPSRGSELKNRVLAEIRSS